MQRIAKIQFGTGSLPRDCMITDVSDGGVKVIAEYLDIPAEFTIIFSDRPPAPMSAGMADRLRIRRSVRRLDRKPKASGPAQRSRFA
jgi:hypothetical protein